MPLRLGRIQPIYGGVGQYKVFWGVTARAPPRGGTFAPSRNCKSEDGQMNVSDLIKATILCGGLAFLVYSFPLLSQIVIIGLLSLLWLSCALQTIQTARRQR